MTNLVGTYQIKKANLYPSHQADFHLIISKRHKASSRKPKDYLLIYQAGIFRYISSLYPATCSEASAGSSEAQILHLEHKGTDYELRLNQAANQAEIRQIEAGGSGRLRRQDSQNA